MRERLHLKHFLIWEEVSEMTYVFIALLVILGLLALGIFFIVKGPKEKPFELKPFTPAGYPFEHKMEQINGSNVAVVDEGKGDRTLVFIHGLGGCIGNWENNIGYFAKKMRVLALDLPGFGLSERRDDIPYGIDYYSEVVIKLLDQKGIDKAAIAGNSMGGHIAAYTALEHPERLTHIILSDAAGLGLNFPIFLWKIGVNHGERLKTTAVRWARWGALKDKEKMRKRFIKQSNYDAKRGNKRAVVYDHSEPNSAKLLDSNLDFILDMILTEQFPHFMHAFFACVASIYNTPLQSSVSRIKVPTLIVWGREDGLVNLKCGYKYNEAISGSQLTIFEKCGHVPMVEKADEFNETVDKFLSA